MPHPLDGCRAKIQRAEESIHNLRREIAEFLESDPPPFNIVKQHQNGGLEYAFLAVGSPEVPLRFAMLAGEIIHHLRSSLDHLIHALVIQNGGTPTRKHQFPVYEKIESFERAKENGVIEGVSPSAEKLIANVQPYTSLTPDDTVLNVVHQYDIVDKHRLLVVVTAVATLSETITIGVDAQVAATPERQGKTPNIVGFYFPGPQAITRDGTVIAAIRLAEPAPELVANATLVPHLAFEKCGRVAFALVVPTLTGLLAGTRHTIESFAGEF